MEYLCAITLTSHDKMSNVVFIEDETTLYKVVADNRSFNKVVVRKDFIDTYFPFNTISKFIDTVRMLNPMVIIETEDYTVNPEVNSKTLDKISKNMNKEGLTMMTLFKSRQMLETLDKLITSYKSDKSFELKSSSIISGLRERVDSLIEENKELKSTLNEETLNKADVQNKLSVLVKRINYTHNVGVIEDMLFRVDSNNFDKVIYIKEVTRVQYVDTLVKSLQEVFRLLYNMPTRVMCIESYYASGKINLYPNLTPHFRLTERDVLSGDILLLGFQPKIVKTVMRNPSNISILIVLDRGGYESPHIFGSNIEYLYTASDPSDVPSSVPRSRIISYKPDTLFIPHIKSFENLSHSEQVQKYSSLKITKQIVGLIE